MINTIAILLTTAAMGIQPQIQHNPHHLVEILPSQTYVLCNDDCVQPTPKTKRTIHRREIDRPGNSYSRIDQQIQGIRNRQEDPARPAYRPQPERPPREMMAAREPSATTGRAIQSEPNREYSKFPAPKEKPKTTYKVIFKKLTPEDLAAAGNTKAPEVKSRTEQKTVDPNITVHAGEINMGSETVYFDLNSSRLSSEESEKLDRWLSEVKATRYKVNGYACPVDREQRSMKLSENRAETVRKFIMERRKNAIVITNGLGGSEVFDSKTLKMNRRVNIVAIDSEPVQNTVVVVPKDTTSKTNEAIRQHIREVRGVAQVQGKEP